MNKTFIEVKLFQVKPDKLEQFEEKIEEMNRTYDNKKEIAESLSDKIREEDGLNEAVRLIESAME